MTGIDGMRDASARTTRARMTFRSALASTCLRLARSPLVPVHLACALAGSLACGAYFASSAWDPAFGADAYVQLLGALMPLMAGIVCGLAVDEERGAGRLANLLAVPSRGRAVCAAYAALLIAGAAALALAVAVFGLILAVAGRLTLGPGALVWAWAGTVLGSAPLYALELALSLRFGRNVAIGVGAAGMILAFFSVGGLAHGLMTGELTAAADMGAFGLVPFAWAARLGSLGIEAAIAAAGAQPRLLGQVLGTASSIGAACAVLAVVAVAALSCWFTRFEKARSDA